MVSSTFTRCQWKNYWSSKEEICRFLLLLLLIIVVTSCLQRKQKYSSLLQRNVKWMQTRQWHCWCWITHQVTWFATLCIITIILRRLYTISALVKRKIMKENVWFLKLLKSRVMNSEQKNHKIIFWLLVWYDKIDSWIKSRIAEICECVLDSLVRL